MIGIEIVFIMIVIETTTILFVSNSNKIKELFSMIHWNKKGPARYWPGQAMEVKKALADEVKEVPFLLFIYYLNYY